MRRIVLCMIVPILGSVGIYAQEAGWDSPLTTCWNEKNPFSSSEQAASDNANNFFLPKSNRIIQAYNALTGGLLWTVQYSGNLISPLLFRQNRLSFAVRVGQGNSKADVTRIFAINTRSGLSIVKGEFPSVPGERTALDGESIVTAIPDGRVSKFAIDGTALWSTRLSGHVIAGVSFVDDLLVVSGSNGHLWVLDASIGKTLQEFDLHSGASGAFALDKKKKRLYAGSAEGTVYAFDLSKGRKRWTSRTGAAIDSISLAGSDILVTSSDNFVYRLADGNGRRLWKRRLAGRILGSVMLGEDLRAFLSLGTRDVVILRVDNGRVVNRFEVEEGDYFTAPPLLAGNRLIVQTDSAVTGIAAISVCPKKQNEDAAKASSL